MRMQGGALLASAAEPVRWLGRSVRANGAERELLGARGQDRDRGDAGLAGGRLGTRTPQPWVAPYAAIFVMSDTVYRSLTSVRACGDLPWSADDLGDGLREQLVRVRARHERVTPDTGEVEPIHPESRSVRGGLVLAVQNAVQALLDAVQRPRPARTGRSDIRA